MKNEYKVLSEQVLTEGAFRKDKIVLWDEQFMILSKLAPKIQKIINKYKQGAKREIQDPIELNLITIEIAIEYDSMLKNKIKRKAMAKGMLVVTIFDANGIWEKGLKDPNEYMIDELEIRYTADAVAIV